MNLLDYLYPKIEMPTSPIRMDFSNIHNAEVKISAPESMRRDDSSEDFLNYMAHQQGVAGTQWIEKSIHGEQITPQQSKVLSRNMRSNIGSDFYSKYSQVSPDNFIDYWRDKWNSRYSKYSHKSTQWDDAIEQAANQTGLSAEFLKTVIGTESDFNPRATNGKYKGLLQIGPEEAREIGLRDPYDPYESIIKGAQLLSQRRHELFK